MTTIFIILLVLVLAISAASMIVLGRFLRDHKKSESIQDLFMDVAEEFNFTVSVAQQLGSRMIGFDERKNKLLFMELDVADQSGYIVDLEKIRYIEVKKVYDLACNRRVDHPSNLRKIALQLEYKSNARPLQLPFYIKSQDPAGELRARKQQADSWKDFLTAYLKPSRQNSQKQFSSVYMTPEASSRMKLRITSEQLN